MRGGSLATVDHWAIDMLSDLVLDVAILGTNGISRDRGLTTPDPAVSAVKHKVVEVSRRRILVAVHTKFGVNSFCRFAEVADFETLVTGAGLTTHTHTATRRWGQRWSERSDPTGNRRMLWMVPARPCRHRCRGYAVPGVSRPVFAGGPHPAEVRHAAGPRVPPRRSVGRT